MPEPVRCEECSAISVPMFRTEYGDILCGGCIREEYPDFEWPPTED